MKKRPIDPKADSKFAGKFLTLGGTGAGMTCWSLWECQEDYKSFPLTCETCGAEFSCDNPLTILYRRPKGDCGCWTDSKGALDVKLLCQECAKAFVSELPDPLEWGGIELKHFLYSRERYPQCLENFLLDCFWGPLKPMNRTTAVKLAKILEKIVIYLKEDSRKVKKLLEEDLENS